MLKGQHFSSDTEALVDALNWINSKQESVFMNGMKTWIQPLEEYVALNGIYVDKIIMYVDSTINLLHFETIF